MNLKKSNEAVSPVIGVILMVAITVVLAAIVFVLVSNLGKTTAETPRIGFTTADNGENYTVLQAPTGLDWADFTTTAGDCDALPTGAVDAGDVISGCNGKLTLVHKPSNGIAYQRP